MTVEDGQTPPAAPPPPTPPVSYRLNLIAFTWPELWRSFPLGMRLVFLACVAISVLFFCIYVFVAGRAWYVALLRPIVCWPFIVPAALAVCKLFGVRWLTPDVFPREIGLKPVDYASTNPQVSQLFAEITALGFEHFTSFESVGTPYRSIVLGLMHRAENAFATVYEITAPTGMIVYCEYTSRFNDGQSMLSTPRTSSIAIKAPPGKHRQSLSGATPARLWEAHRQAVARLAPRAGGVLGPVTPELYVERFVGAWREYIDFQAGRGTFVPAR